MNITLLIFFFFLISSFLISIHASLDHNHDRIINANHSSITMWCNDTPYPDTCNHYVGQVTWPHSKHHPAQTKVQFRVMLVEAALRKAVDAERKVQRWQSKAKDHAQRATWVDCVHLHSSTIRRLNRTLDGLRSSPKSCTNLDAQTWLSSSLTNLETCLTGSGDLNVSSEFVRPMMSGNLTKLISVSLAVNCGFLQPQERRRILHNNDETYETDETDHTEPFPKWFGARERRVLQQVRVRASNVVVARDGSGHFRSVQQAINFAKRRRYKTRFVIRVKRGVYRENIEVDNDNGYIWLIGDGSRHTIITSGRSVGGGASVVVAKDGSGKFKTVQAAIDSAAKRHNFKDKFIIRVKRGVYEENIEVLDSNHHVWLVGDGIGATIITGRRSVGSGSYTTFSSATAGIDGAHFVARGITFRNTAGPTKRQAVALRSASDLAVFYQCSFQGYQDTLFIQTQRQFFRECHVSGTIDFIFGNAAAVFQNCLIRVRRPIVGQTNIITAQGRLNSFEHTGISIHNSRIVPSSELKPVARKFRTYLGRPWMKYSRTVVMKSYLDGMVEPSGWSKWGGSDFGLSTLYFAEYKNFGPGANTKSRVRWKGFHLIRDRSTAKRFTVDGLYAGRAWLPATGVPFTAGL
ncbi:Probable pectinesterase/pectinesterase inhibitor 59 [Linum perenne]